VSTFGFSGPDAPLVIEEFTPEPEPAAVREVPNQPVLLLLSARSEERLPAYVAVIQDSIAARPELDLVDMTYTLQVGRDAMDHRLAICTDSRQALLDGLAAFRAQRYAERVLVGRVRKSRDGAGRQGAQEQGRCCNPGSMLWRPAMRGQSRARWNS
jgi:acyl transferase domain-containing protein